MPLTWPAQWSPNEAFERDGAKLTKFDRATVYVRNALHGRAAIVSSNKSLAARSLYHDKRYRLFHVFVCLTYLYVTVGDG